MKSVIFSAQEVRATLDGSKTQFRRIVKPKKNEPHSEEGLSCPFGKVGDKIFVKETWVELLHTSPATDEPFLCDGDKLIEHATFWIDNQGRKRWRYDGEVIAYRATSEVEFCDGDGFGGEFADKDDIPRWKSPVTMPEWASRLTLEITDVRLQRLQDISEEDAIAEGAIEYKSIPIGNLSTSSNPPRWSLGDIPKDTGYCLSTARYAFANRFIKDNPNGYKFDDESFDVWNANPYVWAVSYKRLP